MPSASCRARIGALVVVGCLLSAPPAAAQETVWLGNTANWDSDANWTLGRPTTTFGPTFAAPSASLLTTNNDTFGLTTSSLTVSSDAGGPVAVGGNPFKLTGFINVASGKSLTVASGLGFSAGNGTTFTVTGSGTVVLATTPVYVDGSAQLQNGTLNLQTTLNSSFGLSAFLDSTLTGHGTITGGLGSSGTVAAGTGAGASTLTVNGGFTGDEVTLVARLFGTGYTNATTSDMGKLAVGGNVAFTGQATIQLDLSALSVSQVAELRANILASGSFRDYAVLTTGGLSGDGSQLTISNYGNFAPSGWNFTQVVSADDIYVRFTPVPEPGAILAVGVGALAALRSRSRRNS